ncbi:transposase [Streptomyces sennicomposti]
MPRRPQWGQYEGGRPEGHCYRQLLDAVRYVVAGGISWRAMPADLPAWSRVYASACRHDELTAHLRAAGLTPHPGHRQRL